ncbi:hypothetical protein FM038_019905 [Shewanella eurypsychrophilus]|uniref:Uncharacterized protein n=1 Tax=Shewanella eurypsychrophilus TaxID=2593656 RepID=A0ABX6V9Q6_9GAMM|nr:MULTISPECIES: hypothetical protein [Shewanella]QFU24189.1 hypothetical protein FS418_21630 [Shewanella sp. YLB-09]QPG59395.1 hypothetical protein FM038_019905 [Shewanella eurypsychrophilus]
METLLQNAMRADEALWHAEYDRDRTVGFFGKPKKEHDMERITIFHEAAEKAILDVFRPEMEKLQAVREENRDLWQIKAVGDRMATHCSWWSRTFGEASAEYKALVREYTKGATALNTAETRLRSIQGDISNLNLKRQNNLEEYVKKHGPQDYKLLKFAAKATVAIVAMDFLAGGEGVWEELHGEGAGDWNEGATRNGTANWQPGRGTLGETI